MDQLALSVFESCIGQLTSFVALMGDKVRVAALLLSLLLSLFAAPRALRPSSRPITSLQEAIDFANRLSSQPSGLENEYQLTQAIRLLGQNQQLGTALSLVQSALQANLSLNTHHFGALLQACRLNQQWDIAESLFERMSRYGVQPTTLHCNIMIAIYSDASRVESIGEMLQHMVRINVPYDAFTFSSAIVGCIKCKDLNRGLSIAEEALNSEFANNTFVFNAVLRSYAESRQWERMLLLFNQAVDTSTSLDSASYSIVISALGESLQFELAQTVFESMSSQRSPTRVRRDSGVYNAMIIACERSRRWKEAIAYLKRMEEDGLKPDCKTLCSTIACCGNAHQWKV